MNDKKKIYFITLGCKVNSRESDGLRSLFLARGFACASSVLDADIIYVNSCTVTSEGAAKSRSALRRARRDSPDAVIVFAGCLSQIEGNTAGFDGMGADIVVGNTERAAVIDMVEKFLSLRSASQSLSDKGIIDFPKVSVLPHSVGERFEPLPFEGDGHTRAFVKIQDGCPRSCSYCIVSKARGNPRSADEQEILSGAVQLARDGHKEIVLCGINLSYYGADTDSNLGILCQKLAKIDGIKRIRLGSLEPDMLSESLCDQLGQCDKLAPHFHLSLQSGSDRVLRNMNRFYDSAEFLRIVERIESRFDRPTFTTDIMVGFPGETQQDFDDTLSVVEKVGFLKVHAFRYSRRAGTVAFDLGGQLSGDEKKKRAAELYRVANIARERTINTLMDLPDSFIAEETLSDGSFAGVTGRYVRCSVFDDSLKKGDLTLVKLCDAKVLSD